ncbi:MAG: AP2 domain-containing protein [Lutibacter sp.]|uniref:hypothetical protein n=1 Tax=Lutibacter sp. TaxID=1925666 RepID=UPI0019F49B3B|nr:hypothetical protein [Lutibacter sp.]NOR27646.1 AP2 domain-containing protein [Lutibacter sp.]
MKRKTNKSRINYNQYLNCIFGRLKLVKILDEMSNDGRLLALVECDCGNEKKTPIRNLIKGVTKSCGCFNKEQIIKRNTKHGFAKVGNIDKIYSVLMGMKQRCYYKKHKDYHNYGGRGITVCDEWRKDFTKFYKWCLDNGYKKGLEIDRRNNDGNYSPDNCRFVTHQINSLNRRKRIDNTSGYIGITCHKINKLYSCQINYKNKKILYKSGFKTAREAAIVRNEYIIENNLPHKLNVVGLLNLESRLC